MGKVCYCCNGSGTVNRVIREEINDDGSTTAFLEAVACGVCGGSGSIPETNGDRIRSMTDEELADWITRLFANSIRESKVVGVELSEDFSIGLMGFLGQPAEEDDHA